MWKTSPAAKILPRPTPCLRHTVPMPPKAFLSYARADGETLAADLRQFLTREAPDMLVNTTASSSKAAGTCGSRSPKPSKTPLPDPPDDARRARFWRPPERMASRPPAGCLRRSRQRPPKGTSGIPLTARRLLSPQPHQQLTPARPLSLQNRCYSPARRDASNVLNEATHQ
jgi:hypothetical protein